MIVVEASVLIAHLDQSYVLHDRAAAALPATAEEPLRPSPITLAEVFVGPARAIRLDDAQAALADLGVVEIAVGQDGAARLAALHAETGLKLPDCCVLLAAEDAQADAILTFDDRLARATEQRGLPVM